METNFYFRGNMQKYNRGFSKSAMFPAGSCAALLVYSSRRLSDTRGFILSHESNRDWRRTYIYIWCNKC